MWLMLQQSGPDYVIASGEQHSVREFVEQAFRVEGWGSRPVRQSPGSQPRAGRSCGPTRATFARPRSPPSWVIPPRPRPSSVGDPASASRAWSRRRSRRNYVRPSPDHLVKSSGYPIYSRQRVVRCTTNDESELHYYCLRIIPKADSPATRPSIYKMAIHGQWCEREGRGG
jgi:hypothetical protein